MDNANYTCPVCGFTGLRFPPKDWHICPCCGTEFENDDVFFSHEELREAWRENGMRWWATFQPEPVDFNPVRQLDDLAILNLVKVVQ